jgi:hypothetical protein
MLIATTMSTRGFDLGLSRMCGRRSTVMGMHVEADSMAFVPAVVPELLLATKESSEKPDMPHTRARHVIPSVCDDGGCQIHG